MNNYFKLNKRHEVTVFESLLSNYDHETTGFAIKHISLIDAFDKLLHHENGEKIFTALYDIQINNVLLYCDIYPIVNLWNKLSRENRNKGSILDSKDNFFDKMDIHRLSTSFIFRYRALWDKIMGLHVLILAPNDYDNFIKSKSKRSQFEKIMTKVSFPKNIIKEIKKILTDFDDKFRTAEAHGTGRFRKMSLLMEPYYENEQVLFIDFANAMNHMIISIGEMIKTMPNFFNEEK
ncbi:MAG: hypothetical protein ABIF11_00335 [Nitrospirota bacterium]